MPPMFDMSWRELATLLITMLTAAGLIGGMVIAWVKRNLSGDFAKSSDIAALSLRVQQVERQMEGMPTHSDLRELNTRLASTESGVAVANAEIRGVREAVDRQSGELRLVLGHLMRDPK